LNGIFIEVKKFGQIFVYIYYLDINAQQQYCNLEFKTQ